MRLGEKEDVIREKDTKDRGQWFGTCIRLNGEV